MRLDASEREYDPGAEAWLPDSTVMQNLRRAMPEDNATEPPEQVFVPGTHQITQIPEGPWQPEQDLAEGARHPLQMPARPEDIRARQYPGKPVPASAEAPQSAPAARSGGDEGFDVQRGLMGLVHGLDGIRAVDSSRAQKAQSEIARAREARQAEMDQFQIDDKRRMVQELAQLREPTSPQSVRAQQTVGQLLGFAAEMFKDNPELQAQIGNIAKGLTGMSAYQIREEVTNDKSPVMYLLGLAQKMQAMKHNAEVDPDVKAWRDTQQKLRERSIAVAEKNAGLRAGDLSRKVDKDAFQKEQAEELPNAKVDRYAQIMTAGKELSELRQLLPKVYSGLGAQKLTAIFQGLPVELDQRSPEQKRFAILVSALRAPERHKLFGSALTKIEGMDSDTFLANLGQNPETVGEALKTLDDALRMEASTYEARWKGAKKTSSKAAELFNQKKQQGVLVNEKPAAPPQAQSAQPAPHGEMVRQNGRTFKWNGTKYVEVK